MTAKVHFIVQALSMVCARHSDQGFCACWTCGARVCVCVCVCVRERERERERERASSFLGGVPQCECETCVTLFRVLLKEQHHGPFGAYNACFKDSLMTRMTPFLMS
jgi:hypothetical protein